jgi:hypothetical protein
MDASHYLVVIKSKIHQRRKILTSVAILMMLLIHALNSMALTRSITIWIIVMMLA